MECESNTIIRDFGYINLTKGKYSPYTIYIIDSNVMIHSTKLYIPGYTKEDRSIFIEFLLKQNGPYYFLLSYSPRLPEEESNCTNYNNIEDIIDIFEVFPGFKTKMDYVPNKNIILNRGCI